MKKIAFLTDIHLDEQFPIENNVHSKENLERVLADVSKRGITEIVFGGDIGDASAHNYFFECLKPFSLNMVIGNHDQFSEVKKHFFKNKERNELFYFIENKGYKYIFLDTSTDEISEAQIEWLKLELVTSKKIIVFLHHPVIEIETPVDVLYPLKNRAVLKAVLLENGKEITLFCGHYHMNDEVIFKNIRQIITQSMSFQIIKNADEIAIDNSCFGYRILHLDNHTIETELVTFHS